MSELVSACAVRRHLGGGPALLLCSLGLVREPELFKQQVLALGHYWDRVEFIDPAIGNGVSDLSNGRLGRLREYLRDSRRHAGLVRAALEKALADEKLADGGRGVSLYFNLLHHYVLHVLGQLPHARRVYYPHGLDQPRRYQLRHLSHYYRPRGWRTLLATAGGQIRSVNKSYFAVAFWLRLSRRSRIPLPFDGVDQAVTFSPARPRVSHDRVPPESLQRTLVQLTTRLDIQGQLAPLFAGLRLDKSAIVLLPELDTQHENRNVLPALKTLLTAVSSRTQADTFLLKPHPRSRYDDYIRLVEHVRVNEPGRAVLPWPKTAMSNLTELVVTLWPVRCVASFGSCALAPWTVQGVPHYASRDAARQFDEGWPTPELAKTYLSTRWAVEVLHDEGLLQALD